MSMTPLYGRPTDCDRRTAIRGVVAGACSAGGCLTNLCPSCSLLPAFPRPIQCPWLFYGALCSSRCGYDAEIAAPWPLRDVGPDGQRLRDGRALLQGEWQYNAIAHYCGGFMGV